MPISTISLDMRMKNGVHNWTSTKGTKYTFRGEPLPAWMTRDSKGVLAGLFPNAPTNIAAAIDRRAFGSSYSNGCYDGLWRRYEFLHALPDIIEGLEVAGLGDHPYTEELRKVLFFVDMWIADEPEITYFSKANGYYRLNVNGYVLSEAQ